MVVNWESRAKGCRQKEEAGTRQRGQVELGPLGLDRRKPVLVEVHRVLWGLLLIGSSYTQEIMGLVWEVDRQTPDTSLAKYTYAFILWSTLKAFGALQMLFLSICAV